MTQIPAKTTFYDQDFCLWVDATVAKLRAGEFGTVDWEHLIEEVEALAKRDRRELESRLRVLMSHLLKRVYVKSPEDYRGWENTIKEQRSEIQLLLKDSPSLKSYLADLFEASWRYTAEQVKDDYPSAVLPNLCPFPKEIEPLLTQKFWLSNEQSQNTEA
ncbi:MAG: DUF29 domain-containing protein [Elainellaceae cyanobacterium]